MIEVLNNIDTQLFYFINHHHCTVMDWTMWVLSSRWCWLVVIVSGFVGATLVREPKKWWIVLAGIALCFLLADQGSVQLFKNTVCRLRPCHALPDVMGGVMLTLIDFSFATAAGRGRKKAWP